MWLTLALIAGLGDAVRDALSKRAAATIPRPLITWSYSLFALPFLIPLILGNLPDSIPFEFWALITFVATCHVCGGLMLVKALHSSDLSVCTPMIAFTPVFLLVVGPALTGDWPSLSGAFGALLVVVGSYVLNLSRPAATGADIGAAAPLSATTLAPLKALYTETGPRLMLALSLLWSVTGSIDRIAVQRFDPIFWGSSQLLAISLFFVPVILLSRAGAMRPTLGELRSLFTIGGANCIALATYLIALQFAPVHYVICVKRLSIPFSVILGRFMFDEALLANRLPGALLMFLGVIIISFFG